MRIAAAIAVAALSVGCKSREPSGSSDKGTETPLPETPTLAVTMIATDVDTPTGIAVDDEYVYWGDAGKLMRAPKQGGDPEVFCKVEAIHIASIAPDGDTLYFGALGGGVFRVRKQSRRPVRIGRSGNPRSLVVDATKVYWYDGSVHSVAKDTDADVAAPASFTAGNAAELVADDTYLYWHTGDAILRTAKDGSGDDERIAHTGTRYVEMAIDDTYLYWGDDTNDVVLRWPKAGGPLELVYDDFGFGNLVIDGDWLYVIDIQTRIERIDTRDLRHASLVYSAADAENSNNVSIVADDTQLFVGVDGMRWETSGGIAHIDLTKPNPDVPGMIPLGKVARMPKDLAGLKYEPRPARKTLATVYFDLGTNKVQDMGNATRWIEGADRYAQPQLVQGKLPIRVVTGGTETAARQRADAVVAALRERLGDAAKIEVALEGSRVDVVIDADANAYANLWSFQ